MPFEILESEQGKPFRFKGIAMIKNSLSGNGRHYSDKLVEATVNNVKSIIESSGSYPLSVMADHPGMVSNKTLTTVGKIVDMYLDGDNAIIEAEIANTSIGKDVQELIRGKFVEGLSIRASKAKMKKMNINGKMVNDVLEMELQGVDLVTNPGVKGAKVLDIIESNQSNSGLFISIEEEEIIEPVSIKEENKLNYSEIVLEELKKQRPDLVAVLKNEFKPVLESELQVDKLQESVDNLTTEKNTLQESLDTLKGEKEVLESDLKSVKESLETKEKELKAIQESEEKAKRDAHIAESIGKLKFADSVKEKLKEKVSVLESTEEIDKVLESEVEFLNMVIQESTGVDLAGKGHTGENKDCNIDEEQDFINLVDGM